MFVRLPRDVDYHSASQLREGFDWASSSIIVDLSDVPRMTAELLGEFVHLANRIGRHNVTLVNPVLLVRQVLAVTRLEEVFRILPSDTNKPSLYNASGHYAA